MNDGRRASERIIERKEALAASITAALYARDPALLERHGEVGRTRCHEDMRYNLEHLAPAVDLGDPSMFARYVAWLDDLLRARNVSTEDVARSLEETDRAVRASFPQEEAEAVGECIRAGLASLDRGEP